MISQFFSHRDSLKAGSPAIRARHPIDWACAAIGITNRPAVDPFIIKPCHAGFGA